MASPAGNEITKWQHAAFRCAGATQPTRSIEAAPGGERAAINRISMLSLCSAKSLQDTLIRFSRQGVGIAAGLMLEGLREHVA